MQATSPVALFVEQAAVAPVAATAFAQDELSIAIKPGKFEGSVAVIDINSEFELEFSNNSNQPIRIITPNAERGHQGVSFEFKNENSGETVATSRPLAASEESPRGAGSVTIEPGATYTTKVLLDGGQSWLRWLDLPAPYADVTYTVRARYEIESNESGIWKGKCEASPLKARVVASLYKTPHNYLWNGFPKVALRQMQQAPQWIHRRNESRQMPLHIAARSRHLEAAKWLLDNGADVNARGYNGCTPLHFASDPEVAKLILRYKPDLSIASQRPGRTPLQSAVEQIADARSDEARANWKKIARLYLAAGAVYDLPAAIELNDLEQVKKLYASGQTNVDDSYDIRSPLRRAATSGHAEICEYLIRQHNIDVDQFEEGSGYPIIKNALHHPQVVKVLISNGADLKTRITWRGNRTGVWIIGDEATALHFAADKGVPETITQLIDAGVDVFANTKGSSFRGRHEQTALDVAAIFGMGENAKAVVTHPKFLAADAGLRREILDRCLLHGAISSFLGHDADRPRLIEVLLEAGADPNVTDEHGATPTQRAARNIHPNDPEENTICRQMVDLLQRHGAELDLFSAVAIGDAAAVANILQRDRQQLDMRGPDGYPALHFAVAMDYLETVKVLVDAGANVDIRNESERTGTRQGTPLHAAAFWGRPEIAKILIDAGANVNASSQRGGTPLHSAARLTNIETARLLLEHGAKVDAKDADGESPLDWCRELNWTNAAEMEKLLLEYQDK